MGGRAGGPERASIWVWPVFGPGIWVWPVFGKYLGVACIRRWVAVAFGSGVDWALPDIAHMFPAHRVSGSRSLHTGIFGPEYLSGAYASARYGDCQWSGSRCLRVEPGPITL